MVRSVVPRARTTGGLQAHVDRLASTCRDTALGKQQRTCTAQPTGEICKLDETEVLEELSVILDSVQHVIHAPALPTAAS